MVITKELRDFCLLQGAKDLAEQQLGENPERHPDYERVINKGFKDLKDYYTLNPQKLHDIIEGCLGVVDKLNQLYYNS